MPPKRVELELTGIPVCIAVFFPGKKVGSEKADVVLVAAGLGADKVRETPTTSQRLFRVRILSGRPLETDAWGENVGCTLQVGRATRLFHNW